MLFCGYYLIYMRLTTFFNLSFFDLDGFSEIELSDFIIKNDYEIRENFFKQSDIKGSIGEIDCKHPREGYMMYNKPFDVNLKLPDAEIYNQMNIINHRKMDELIDLLNCLWLVKDNSINITNVVSWFPNKALLSKLLVQISFCDCGGVNSMVRFNREETIQAHDFFIKYKLIINRPATYIKDENDIFLDRQAGITRTLVRAQYKDFDYNKTNCIERAFHFLQTARSQDYLIYKIAFYMPVLECLFCTNSNEITTKLRYRIAFYIGSDKDEIIKIDDLIKDCYDIRSKFLHGQIYSKKKAYKPSELLDYSVKIDKVIRRVLRKIIEFDSDTFLELDPEIKEKKLHGLIFDRISST